MDDKPLGPAQEGPNEPEKRRKRRESARTTPPPVRKMKGRMTPDQKVDEASIESMDGSDPPGYLPMGVGAPDERQTTDPDEDAIRRLAYEIWEREGRQSGRDEEYWQRARDQLRSQAAERTGKKVSG
jgi:hypothetical protein